MAYSVGLGKHCKNPMIKGYKLTNESTINLEKTLLMEESRLNELQVECKRIEMKIAALKIALNERETFSEQCNERITSSCSWSKDIIAFDIDECGNISNCEIRTVDEVN